MRCDVTSKKKREYFTAAEVSTMFSIPYRTTLYMLMAGTIHGVKVGKAWRISAEEVLRIKREGT